MVLCEMCGKEVGRGIRIRVDRAVLVVGPECTRFGIPAETPPKAQVPRVPAGAKTLQRRTEQQPSRPQRSKETDLFESHGNELVQDYPKRIQKARNSLGLNQEELAAKLNEKRSVVRDLESGTLVPNDALIRKLEKQLKITLTESVSHEYKLPPVKHKGLTLGDLMKE